MQERVNMFARVNNEQGFVLVFAIVMLFLLVIIGFSASNLSFIESKISGNEKAQNETFYATDGGAQASSEFLEENASCPSGFASQDITPYAKVYTLDFYLNEEFPSTAPRWPPSIDAASSDAEILKGSDLENPIYLSFGSTAKRTSGGSLTQLRGYLGKGKGGAGGGIARDYDVYARYRGNNNSETLIKMQWRHALNMEGECRY
ncbi:pilus assembly PilX family protein [Thiovibrio sp. JS02]